MAKSELSALSNAMADAVEKAAQSTVMVDARRRIPASGIALTKDLILTANHVVERDEEINVVLPDGKSFNAAVLGRDPNSDLALLKIEGGSATPAEINGEARIGQFSLALGRPSEEGIQASLGVVSAVGGPSRTRSGGTLEGHLRTDATPYPGFSGGPLVDAEGKVIGINTSGLGFGASLAIPIELAKKIADTLEKHGSIKRGFMGIRSQTVDLPAKSDLGREQQHGLLIVGMEDDSPAAEGDLLVGDILVGFNGQPVESHEELLAMLNNDVVGKATPVEVLRGGKPTTVDVTIGERKEAPRRKGRRRRMMFGMPGRGFRGHRGRGFHFKSRRHNHEDD